MNSGIDMATNNYLSPQIYISKSLALACLMLLAYSNPSFAANTTNNVDNGNRQVTFRKTDSSLLFEIETLKRKSPYIKRPETLEKRELPPKQKRFEIAKKGIYQLMGKNAVPNSLIGGLLGAAATVHPAGIILGTIAGTLQGKSKRYEEAQAKLHEMEKDIFQSKDHEVTAEEIRLASYTGADLSEFFALAPPSEEEIAAQEEEAIAALIEEITGSEEEMVLIEPEPIVPFQEPPENQEEFDRVQEKLDIAKGKLVIIKEKLDSEKEKLKLAAQKSKIAKRKKTTTEQEDDFILEAPEPVPQDLLIAQEKAMLEEQAAKRKEEAPPMLAHCYGLHSKDNPPFNALSRRILASQCFYHMN
ncbi:MAG: hypothetical protein COA99_02185 [Moraxellaceae bacterium]|nr:MAG: hypothetical protein COA99_02185 [Moraxellaceae bacterium]